MVETDHGLTPQILDLKVKRNLRKINELPNRPRASAGFAYRQLLH